MCSSIAAPAIISNNPQPDKGVASNGQIYLLMSAKICFIEFNIAYTWKLKFKQIIWIFIHIVSQSYRMQTNA